MSHRPTAPATLTIENVDDVYAIGDCAEVEGMNLPATAQVARQQVSFFSFVIVW